jgi:hypothetical protein
LSRFLRRPKPDEPLVRVAPRTEVVYALTDVSKNGRWVRKGEPLPRDHVMVRELPSAFEVRYPLIEEGNDCQVRHQDRS